MSSAIFAGLIAVGFMVGLYFQAKFLVTSHQDPSHTYGLYAVRDRLIRLVVDKKIDRTDPHFDAIYENVNRLLMTGHCLNGPDGWGLAQKTGRHFARNPGTGRRLVEVPRSKPPAPLAEVSQELCVSLRHMLENHIGISMMISSQKREYDRIQKESARHLLEMMPSDGCHV